MKEKNLNDNRPNMVTEEFIDRYAIELAKKDDKHSCQVIVTAILDSLGVFVRGGKTREIDYPMFQSSKRNERKDDGIFRNS